jgi:hypothetical protein
MMQLRELRLTGRGVPDARMVFSKRVGAPT